MEAPLHLCTFLCTNYLLKKKKGLYKVVTNVCRWEDHGESTVLVDDHGIKACSLLASVIMCLAYGDVPYSACAILPIKKPCFMMALYVCFQ